MNIESVSNHPAIDVAVDTISNKKQILVFVESKRSAEKTADDIVKVLKKRMKPSAELLELSEQIGKAVSSPTKQCMRLATVVKYGVSFHHSGLVSKQRSLIEHAFRKGLITTICATPTLAYGMDLPAYRVVLKSLKRYTGKWGMNWIPVLDYLQIAGRAGRPKFHDDFGEVITLAKSETEKDEIFARYISGEPESIFSKLAVEPVLRTYILSLIATGFSRTREDLVDFFSQTFWAHQYKDMIQLERIIDKMIALLEKWDFIITKEDDFVSADKLGEQTLIRATLLGRRVAQLYIDPYTAHHLVTGLLVASKKRVTPFSLLQLISYTLEMRPLLRIRSKEQDLVQETLLEKYDELLVPEPSLYDPGYDEFLNSIKTTIFFSHWIDEDTEEILLEKYLIRPGEIRAKIDQADWLLYALEELAPLLKLQPLLKEIKKLRLRVKYGVSEELLTLLKLKNVGRIRARKLYKNGMKDLGILKNTDISILSQIVGPRIAASIKEQLGQKGSVKIGKRRGQMGLGKYT